MNTIQETIKNYFDAWNEAFTSKNADNIRSFMSNKFTGYWAHSTIEKPDEYGYNYDLPKHY
ncbi:hypothetical protein [Virgibacillus ndiopensis]|uniref:hypothetical protein n=1 Tax=Virgibacillus ndiopensis TaxID=2004408 RepID=UPI001FE3A634|nr:hypothetical protein [Virgibacillus ndiopensis]